MFFIQQAGGFVGPNRELLVHDLGDGRAILIRTMRWHKTDTTPTKITMAAAHNQPRAKNWMCREKPNVDFGDWTPSENAWILIRNSSHCHCSRL